MKAILLSLLVALTNSVLPSNADVLFDAMNDELTRSVGQLKIEKHDKPYYVSYRIDDYGTLDIKASFGSLVSDQLFQSRLLWVDVHVGDYQLDSGNMRRHYWGDFDIFTSLSLDDNYDAIRHKLWLQTDTAYKQAVENLENKKAALQQKSNKERPDDWSREKPLTLVQTKGEFTPDRSAWQRHIKDLSSVFKDFPQIKSSSINFKEFCNNRYIVNSEGSRIRVCERNCTITASGFAQTVDGLKINDSVVIAAADEKQMPTYEELKSRVQQLAKRISETVAAKENEMYQGPVMFEGEASAQFFNKTLAPSVVVKRPYDAERVTEDVGQSRLGRRILPTFIDVSDDPDLKDVSGARAPGYSDVDAQGVATEAVNLVEKGILKTLLSTRLPTLKIRNSNGHAVGWSGQAGFTNLVVHSDTGLDTDKLKAKLMELGKDNGLDYVLVVRKLKAAAQYDSLDSFDFDESDMPRERGRGDRIDLPPAVECVRLYITDGHEEPVRGAEFAMITTRILRDIVATGDDVRTYPQSGGGMTITAPSMILRDVEVQKSHVDGDKPPVLPHPYFAK